MLWKHHRGNHAAGWFVDLPYMNERVSVRSNGTFEIPDDAPQELITFLEVQTRHSRVLPPKAAPVELPPEPVTPKPQQKLPEPEPEPAAQDYPDWPLELKQLKGIGTKTAEAVGKAFDTPLDVLSYEGNPTHVKGLTLPAWLNIKDYVRQTYTTEE